MLSPTLRLPRPDQVLDRRSTLSTVDADEAQKTIEDLFCAHRLTPLDPGGRVDLTLRSATTASVGVHLLDYGADVRISPRALENFFLVQMPLQGRATMDCGNETIKSDARLATLPPIDRDFSMVWEAGTPQLILYASLPAMEEAARRLFGAELAAGLRLGHSLDLKSPSGQALLRAAFELHDALNSADSAAAPYALKLLEEAVLQRWLLAVPNNVSLALGQWDGGQATTAAGSGTNTASSAATARLVKRFTELLERHSAEDVMVSELAEALGVPLRTLQAAVSAETGSTPMALLRTSRLLRARRMLQECEPNEQSVTMIAQDCGFAHLGRFAQAYYAAFGELPSATLRS
ncbi:AraC family transcriptional regulator [Sinomonas sp. JGH33]|uniref:AraC family transcriptional regulator n=1 Tax=Sinomonas terricola TaxID=3110330 RepID=A0ABU5T3Q4_9MICC|nr:AraC family transcriptional regulator [Sinomonas sp. JGH33]MEA5454205.1 AraC family transcriptional regulator [Sinomonas sp. JGH33]